MRWAGIERPGVGPFIAWGVRNIQGTEGMPTSPQSRVAGRADPSATSEKASVLVFDVNETLLDIEAMAPLFAQIFGDPRAMREWFGQLVMYSMTADNEIHRIKEAMLTMPAHPDVADALTKLRDNGFRLVALTNSPPNPDGQSPLEHAGLGGFFERQFSVDTWRTFKPDSTVYRNVRQELDVAPAECMIVAAHVWDTIGAQSVGFSAALVTRSGNAPLLADGLPQPTLVAGDLLQLAQQLGKP
jgi:2-haloacid dehalogenase